MSMIKSPISPNGVMQIKATLKYHHSFINQAQNVTDRQKPGLMSLWSNWDPQQCWRKRKMMGPPGDGRVHTQPSQEGLSPSLKVKQSQRH